LHRNYALQKDFFHYAAPEKPVCASAISSAQKPVNLRPERMKNYRTKEEVSLKMIKQKARSVSDGIKTALR
jgi:IS30 family transposase